MSKRLFLIDGSALAYRSYFAFGKKTLTNSKGVNTSAIFGFTSTIMKILEEEKPDYIGVVFDSHKPTFRHIKYKEYKATREKMPQELVEQLSAIEEIVKAFNIPFIIKEGFEADDIIGTLVVKASKADFESFIVSGDKDFMQLISPNIKMYNLKKGEKEIIDEEEVFKKFGIKPDKIPDIFALTGDTSDNIPGVLGIGEKRAVELINKYSSLENIFQNIDKIPLSSIRENIKKYKEEAILSKELATIDKNVPLDINFEELQVKKPDYKKLLILFKQFEFESLIKKLSIEQEDERNYIIIKNIKEFNELINQLKNSSQFVFDIESTSINPLEAEIVGISFAIKEKEAFYLPLITNDNLFEESNLKEDINYFLDQLKPIFLNENIKKGGQNIKYDILVLSNYGIDVKGIEFDTMVESYLIDPTTRQHNLDFLSIKYLDIKKIPIEDLIKSGKQAKSMREVSIFEVGRYSCEDSDITLRLHNIFLPKLIELNLFSIYKDVEIPLINVLAKMEKAGISIDPSVLQDLSKFLSSQIDIIVDKIYKLAGEEFNINSPKQLAYILYDKLELHKKIGKKQPKKTATGYSTDVSALEKLAQIPEADIVREILEYRTLAKLKNTYADTLPQLINPKTKRIHTSFNQTITATGRLSSSNPNLQNIPIKTELGKVIRKAFIPKDPKNSVIMSADYSQIELRILAHLCNDSELIKTFLEGKDIHKTTASKIFGISEEEVTSEMRNRAKAINFGIIYGMGPQRLAQETKISLNEAENFIKNYFEKYPSIKEYIDRQIKIAKEQGFVTTILGRRRNIEGIESNNPRLKVEAEHIAINTPIQGSAADMIKVAMINIDKKMQELKLESKMILQVHDELVFEVLLDEIEILKKLVTYEMENAIPLKVPLKVEVGIGKNWLEAHQ